MVETQVFTDKSYAPKHQDEIEKALARGNIREVQTILNQLPFPGRINESTEFQHVMERLESNRKYSQAIIEAHTALLRKYDEKLNPPIFKK